MNTLVFYKYQGTGNDFIMIDNRNQVFDKNDLDLIRRLCHRNFGVGADGLILIENHPDYDFEMIYFNPDGSKSFCGNGSRCAVAFAYSQQMIREKCSFLAIDGPHKGEILADGRVSISVKNVSEIESDNHHLFINTGSPHYVSYVTKLDQFPVVEEARKIRYNERFKKEGTNVNFVEDLNGSIRVRTYERGVENETLSCGSGVTACALSYAFLKGINQLVKVKTEGGNLEVSFNRQADTVFTDIRLMGPAIKVFKGEVHV